MQKEFVIRLSKANKVFPNKITKVRYEDIIGILSNKSNFVSEKEYIKFSNITDKVINPTLKGWACK